MKTEIAIFNNSAFGEVRVIESEEIEPMFCLVDICRILDLIPSKVSQRLSEDVLSKYPLETSGGKQILNFVNEDGLYDVILDSRKPEAKAFRKWVTSEVLPSLRKTGAYMITSPDDNPEIIVARAILWANSKIEELKEQQTKMQRQIDQKTKLIEIQSPKVEYYDEVLKSNSLHTITTIAATYNMSGITLNRILLMAKVIRKTGDEYSVTAKYQEKNVAKPEKFKYVNSKGETGTKNDLRWTERGQFIIHDIVKRAINAGVLKLHQGRYIINQDWIKRYNAQKKIQREQQRETN